MKLSQNMKAFLDMIAVSEIGEALLKVSDNGYNVIVGSTPTHPMLFADYSQHPKVRVPAMNSDAAGRYQFMGRYWSYYQNSLNLPDFGHDSQDKWAIQLIRECKAIDDIEAGDIEDAITKCRSRWASFPGAGYDQHENKMTVLVAAYHAAGGVSA
jgi:muramidase (phage lysozyme)